jgi:hypothetical protein
MLMEKATQLSAAIQARLDSWYTNLRIRRNALQVRQLAHPGSAIEPVIFFNASTRLVGMSLNSAFALLAAWALRLQDVPVVQFVCQSGLSRCVLGTDRNDLSKTPPCQKCINQSRWLYTGAQQVPFTYQEDNRLKASLQDLTLDQLMEFEYQPPDTGKQLSARPSSTLLPLGPLVLPSIRWVLRRHHLNDDEPTRFLFRQYILSAGRVAQEFSALLDRAEPQAVILFNGQLYPEATARWVSLHRSLPTITHEVGLRPFTAFFTTGEATAYPLQVPESFELSPAQNARLDAYLSQRFQGQFSMAGIKFWPEIKGLDQAFLDRAASFKQVVPVFTNVVFDTSQPHSNVVFPHMFAWLDEVLQIARQHPETLFVIRAHPDETRPGKASQQSVSQWMAQNQADRFPNLIFVDSTQPLSSYELVHCAKFVMVYNSTIGLEASIMGSPVLCAGRARFTQLPTVFFPPTPQEFRQLAETFLSASEISIPVEFKRNARRFLYYQLFYSSLPFGDFIEPEHLPGFVRMRDFPIQKLAPENSPTIRVLLEGILEGKPFLLDDDPGGVNPIG